MFLQPIFHHPFSLIISGPSNCGKSTLTLKLIKNSHLLLHGDDDGNGFDCVFVLYRSYQPLYDQMKEELNIPVYLFNEKTTSDDDFDFEKRLAATGAKRPVAIIDDGITKENQSLVKDLFCRMGHHLSVSVILIGQSLFDCQNSGLRICHRNTKALIIFNCPRDLGSLRTLIYQMTPERKKASILLKTVEKELTEKPYNYVMFDFDTRTPASQRIKTNIFCEQEPFYPVCLVFSR